MSVIISTCLALGAGAANAASVVAADAAVVHSATFASELAVIDKTVFQAGQMVDFSGTSIFWVLGGGLVALSLVARRISR